MADRATLRFFFFLRGLFVLTVNVGFQLVFASLIEIRIPFYDRL